MTTVISTIDDLVAAFRRIDRKEVELADDLTLPIPLLRVATWCHNQRSYLLFRDTHSSTPQGIIFRRTPTASVAIMCEWCHRVRSRGEVQLLSARVTAHRTIGQYLCADLSCFSLDTPANSPYEPPDASILRVEKALVRMHTLVSQRLMPS